jgi:hypothetical protein
MNDIITKISEMGLMDEIRIFNYILDVFLTFSLVFFIGAFFLFPTVYEGPSFTCFLDGRWTSNVGPTSGYIRDLGFPGFITPFIIIGSIGVILLCWMTRFIDVSKIKDRKRLRLEITRASRIILSVTSTLGFVGAYYFRSNFLLISNNFTAAYYIAIVIFAYYSLVGFIGSFTVIIHTKKLAFDPMLQNYAEIIVHETMMEDFENIFLKEFKANIAKSNALHLFDIVVAEKMLVEEYSNDYHIMAKPFILLFAGQIDSFKENALKFKNKNKHSIAEQLINSIEDGIEELIASTS